MQDINSDERYSQFTQAVLEAAEREAAALITGAEKEKADLLRAGVHSVAEDEYKKLTAKAEHWRSQTAAEISQKEKKDLLIYRDSLTDRLMQTVLAKCNEFTCSAAYKTYLQNKLQALSSVYAEDQSVLYVSAKDEALLIELCKTIKNISVEVDTDIVVGGFCLACKNKIYDETLDTGLIEEKERFLTYCGLKVV